MRGFFRLLSSIHEFTPEALEQLTERLPSSFGTEILRLEAWAQDTLRAAGFPTDVMRVVRVELDGSWSDYLTEDEQQQYTRSEAWAPGIILAGVNGLVKQKVAVESLEWFGVEILQFIALMRQYESRGDWPHALEAAHKLGYMHCAVIVKAKWGDAASVGIRLRPTWSRNGKARAERYRKRNAEICALASAYRQEHPSASMMQTARYLQKSQRWPKLSLETLRKIIS